MAKFIFRFETILDIRIRNEEKAQIEYSKAKKEYDFEEQKILSLKQEYDIILNSNKENLNEKISFSIIVEINKYLLFLKKEIENRKKILVKLEKVVIDKKQDMLVAIKERKAIEKLKEKAYAEYLESQNKIDQQIIDGIVSFKYNKN